MDKNREISTLYLGLGILGEIIILAGFLVLTPSDRSSIAWMNWAVISFVFGLNFFSTDLLFPPPDGFNQRIPAIGIRMVVCTGASIIFIVWMFLGYRWHLSMKVQLLGHVVIGFASLIGFTLAAKSSVHVGTIEEAERNQELFLVAARSEIKLLATIPADDPLREAIMEKIKSLAEELRFISPCADPQAQELEKKILDQIRLIGSLISPAISMGGRSNDETVRGIVEGLSLLITQRKLYRASNGME
ncbi:MAG: hypothetical protein CVU49_09920 [Candidatus Cloacimonetes bacterium HGW-Cloacimonetes-2]|jgi:hypothetical protein|nr:MAG: hypothetical protein CVU49_09920 [Candidatus Cloacimonetes bacterium HGW-Cloacimonetes-2]